MVTTGYPLEESRSRTTEIMKIWEDKFIKCDNLDQFEIGLMDATSAVVNGKPLLCGGSTDFDEYHNGCYIFDENSWRYLTNLTVEKTDMASISVNGYMWVTGGHTG